MGLTPLRQTMICVGSGVEFGVASGVGVASSSVFCAVTTCSMAAVVGVGVGKAVGAMVGVAVGSGVGVGIAVGVEVGSGVGVGARVEVGASKGTGSGAFCCTGTDTGDGTGSSASARAGDSVAGGGGAGVAVGSGTGVAAGPQARDNASKARVSQLTRGTRDIHWWVIVSLLGALLCFQRTQPQNWLTARAGQISSGVVSTGGGVKGRADRLAQVGCLWNK